VIEHSAPASTGIAGKADYSSRYNLLSRLFSEFVPYNSAQVLFGEDLILW
jgi:hypothetical protein